MEAGDSEEEAVQVFGRPWSIRRVDFSSLKLYMYAHIWIGAIIADLCRESTSDEQMPSLSSHDPLVTASFLR